MIDEVFSFIPCLPTLRQARAGNYSHTLVLWQPILGWTHAQPKNAMRKAQRPQKPV